MEKDSSSSVCLLKYSGRFGKFGEAISQQRIMAPQGIKTLFLWQHLQTEIFGAFRMYRWKIDFLLIQMYFIRKKRKRKKKRSLP